MAPARVDLPLLSVANLTVERGGRTVISGLSFDLDRGETVLVSGRNGTGKSTLLRTVSGLLQPAAGQIRFGLATEDVRGVETAHYLGYEDALKPSLTVAENLRFWASMLRGLPSSPDAPGTRGAARISLSVRDSLGAFGIARLAELPSAYLSAGQKRRVALARLLLTPRPLWLLDEPFLALDAESQATLASIMAHHVDGGGAILLASHQSLVRAAREITLDTPSQVVP